MYTENPTDAKQDGRSYPVLARHGKWVVLLACVLRFGPPMSYAQESPTGTFSQVQSRQRAGFGTSDACSNIVTIQDASRCITSAKGERTVPILDPGHVYDLMELIDIAEEASPAGRMAWAAAKASLERAGIDRARYLPVLTLVAQGSDARGIVPFPKPIAPRGYVTIEQPLAYAQLEMEYSLLDFDRGPRLDASRALELASTLRLGRTHQTIAYSTSLEFYRTQQAIGQLTAARIISMTAETLLNSAQLQYDNGRSTLPDLQNAQAGAAEARFDLSAAQGEVKKAKLALTESIGVEPTTEVEILQQKEETPASVEGSIAVLIDAAWALRPDLLARAQEVRRAQALGRVAHAAYLPQVAVGAAGGQTAAWPTADYGQLGYANVSTWSAEVKLKWELFNGARSHEVATARAEQLSAVEEQRETRDAVTRQVWDAYVDYQTASEQQRSSGSFLAAAQTSYDSSLDAYKFGVRSLVDVVQAERQLAQARLAVVKSQAQMMQSAVALSYATGGLGGASGAQP